MTHIHIDGSMGEGGGQILRSSLALSLITGKSLSIEKIRANRERPGLRRQHLTALDAATQVGQCHTCDARVGTTELVFEPNGIRGGEHVFDIKTAGSTTLTLQAILPALILAKEPSKVTLIGGTHNPMAPPFDFLQHVFFPIINRLGPKVDAKLIRYGFYSGRGRHGSDPLGRGEFQVEIQPVEKLQPLHLLDRGEIRSQGAKILIANLPSHIAEREKKTVLEMTGWKKSMVSIEEIDASEPGNAVMLHAESKIVSERCTGFGELGVRAEKVARRAVKEFLRYLESGVPVGEHLADQLMLPLGIAAWQGAGQSQFVTLPLTSHSTTHIEILKRFLEIEIHVEEIDREKVLVQIG